MRIRNADLDRRPQYYTNIVGGPYIDRLQSVNVKRGVPKVEKIIYDDQIANSSGAITNTLTHGSGFKPYVIGSYHIVDSDDSTIKGKRGMIPERRDSSGFWWVTEITSITNNKFSYKVTVDGMGAGRVKTAFYILRERVFGTIQKNKNL